MKTAFLRSLFMLAMLIVASPGTAQTIGYADAMRVLVDSCGKDIEKYCKKVRLGDNRIQNCLTEHADKVSAMCKQNYARAYVQLQERFAAQASVDKICAGDAQRLCRGIRSGKGYLLQCLLNKRNLGNACSQVLTDAGYR